MAKESVSVRKKVVCSVVIAIAALLFIFAFSGAFFTNQTLKSMANFFVGSFGMSFYGMMIALIVACSFVLSGKKVRVPTKYAVHFVLTFVEIVMLVHLFSTTYLCYKEDHSLVAFSQYANWVWHYYTGVPTFGGIVFGSIVFGLQKVITIYGAAILLFGLLAWSVITVGDFFYSYFTGKIVLDSKHEEHVVMPTPNEPVSEPVAEDERAKALRILFDEQTVNPQVVEESETADIYNVAPQSTLDTSYTGTDAHDVLFNQNRGGGSFFQRNDETSAEMGAQSFFANTEVEQPVSTQKPVEDDMSWRISRPTVAEVSNSTQTTEVRREPQSNTKSYGADEGWITANPKNVVNDERIDVVDVVTERRQPEVVQNVAEQPAVERTIVTPAANVQQQQSQQPEQTLTFEFEEDSNDSYEDNDFSAVAHEEVETSVFRSEPIVSQPAVQEPEVVKEEPVPIHYQGSDELVPVEKETVVPGGVQVGFDFRTKEELKEVQEKVHKYPKYVAPMVDLFNEPMVIDSDDEDFRTRAVFAITNKLSVFGIKVESAGQVVGPTVTRYKFEVKSLKTKMSDFNQYAQDLKACLEAEGEIRIEAPIPGTNLVGIEVANKVRTPVALRTILESKAYREKKGGLIFVVGQEISGEMVLADLTKLPHLLVAGTTGSGKSVFLHSMIASLMFRYGPEYLRFIMVDPKLVEFGRYDGIPHLLTSETIINATDALAAMDYLVAEMESRYQLLRQYNVANIADYNAKINPKLTQKLPYLVLIVDELADLMSVSKKSFEAKLQRLAQKARAAGIHLVLATQRPDTQIISGTIKTNFPCRIALKVSSAVDSGTILNGGGAEKLLGHGDLLYMNPSSSELARIQGAYLSDAEISGLVEFVKSQNESYYDPGVSKEIFVSQKQEEPEEVSVEKADDKEKQLDPYCKKALRFWLERQGGRASIASIQRSLQIGFNRAGRIMDTLQKLHYVEEPLASESSSKPLRVLVTLDQLDELFPDMDGNY